MCSCRIATPRNLKSRWMFVNNVLGKVSPRGRFKFLFWDSGWFGVSGGLTFLISQLLAGVGICLGLFFKLGKSYPGCSWPPLSMLWTIAHLCFWLVGLIVVICFTSHVPISGLLLPKTIHFKCFHRASVMPFCWSFIHYVAQVNLSRCYDAIVFLPYDCFTESFTYCFTESLTYGSRNLPCDGFYAVNRTP